VYKCYCRKFSARSRAGKFTNSYSTGILGPENIWFHTFIYISFLSYYYIRNSKNRWNDPYAGLDFTAWASDEPIRFSVWLQRHCCFGRTTSEASLSVPSLLPSKMLPTSTNSGLPDSEWSMCSYSSNALRKLLAPSVTVCVIFRTSRSKHPCTSLMASAIFLLYVWLPRNGGMPEPLIVFPTRVYWQKVVTSNPMSSHP